MTPRAPTTPLYPQSWVYKRLQMEKWFIHKMPRVIEGLEIGSTKLNKPFRLIAAGGSGSGKTEYVKNLVNKNHFSSSFDQIYYFYPDYLPEIPAEFDTQVIYKPGLPCKSELASLPRNTLLILDDLMTEVSQCEDISKLFSVIARKRNISIILIVQNIYERGRYFRNIRLNATGLVLFKFYASVDVYGRIIRDLGLCKYVTKQQMEDIYEENFQYIYLDLDPNCQYNFGRVRSNIFDEYFSIYYQMEYIAIPKADFIKYFKVIEAKKGKVKAISSDVEIWPKKKKQGRKRKREPTPEPEPESDCSEVTSQSSSDDEPGGI